MLCVSAWMPSTATQRTGGSGRGWLACVHVEFVYGRGPLGLVTCACLDGEVKIEVWDKVYGERAIERREHKAGKS